MTVTFVTFWKLASPRDTRDSELRVVTVSDDELAQMRLSTRVLDVAIGPNKIPKQKGLNLF